ncbi:solute carrier organic anion transporter family member 1B2 [Mus pahari]|uniref:solute carrier organic anion transporter family member 1B2 n=1 Tax=Mus pahari TaxID=10093 RepID=UPI000A3111DC|nr:solute carrier organic anion transporter family member 1B2 [Mus pahari]XP_029390460.1 solute carrier organic anion transporter family member 1B2 [Mus pahari]XP_029390461.1 solute carrier organic anion transporter family member 1B2 [Mus pahari]XP_029390462.1 solute carrier organic anion transporter family member 1B2 [Mus pahari]
MDQTQHSSKAAEAQPSRSEKTRHCDGFRLFLAALSFSYVCKALGGTIMKSSITQIERRFDIPSSISGLIDGGFEIGNLLVIVFVSYFGSKLHRPKLIGIGCFTMGIGSILIALPHFFMGYYRYATENDISSLHNSTLTCLVNQTTSLTGTSPEIMEKGCEKGSKSYTWIYVLMGNMLRGIGETPIVPLGISYIDDFAKEGNSSTYLGTLHTIAMIGPILGFIMTSVFAKLYVDIGYVDLSSVRITPQDARWVGAWWLSFIVNGLLCIICSIPFFFLPKIPKRSQKERKNSACVHVLKTDEEKNHVTNSTTQEKQASANITGFLWSLKRILTNDLYVTFLILTLLQVSSFIGSFTYLFKFIEQQFGKTASQANFLLGIITVPTIASGMFLGGYIIKRLKLTLHGITKFVFFTSIMAYVFQLLYFLLICENKSFAGLTLTYDGMNPVDSHIEVPLSYCNKDCICDKNQWEPVCGENGVTYISPCLAGCKSFRGDKKLNNTEFYDCSCVSNSDFQKRNHSARLGECPRDKCKTKYYFYITFQVIISFFIALGSTSLMLILIKGVQPELKSLAMGFHLLVVRALGGILAPVYYGALIDRTCIKWSVTSCGARGACRLYNSRLFGITYVGLNIALKTPTLVLYAVLIYITKRKMKNDNNILENGRKFTDEGNPESVNKNGYYCVPSDETNCETPL